MPSRLDPAAATGLALTLALVIAIGGGLLLGVLAYLVRTNSFLTGIDNGVAKWGHRHASPGEMHVLNDITQLGSIYTVIALCVLLGSGRDDPGTQRLGRPVHRRRNRWRGDPHAHRQGSRRPGAARFQPRRRYPRPVVPQRSLRDVRGLLCDCRAVAWTMETPAGPCCSGRACGGNRSCGRRQPRPARRPLAVRCHRRSCARLGLVRGLRNRLRRTHSAVRRNCRNRRPGRGRDQPDRAVASLSTARGSYAFPRLERSISPLSS